MNCTRCDEEVDSMARFCQSCGLELIPQESDRPVEHNILSPPRTRWILKKRSLSILSIIVIAVIALVILLRTNGNDTHYNKIKLNDSVDKLTSTLGEPQQKSALGNGTGYSYQGVTFATKNGKVIGFSTSDDVYKTNKGIKVGSKLLDVVKAYDPQNLKQAGTSLFYFNNSEDIIYIFTFMPSNEMDKLYETSEIMQLGITQYTNDYGQSLVKLPELQYDKQNINGAGSGSSKASETNNKKLMSQGKEAYQILQKATSGGNFRKLTLKDEDTIIEFLNLNNYDADSSPYGPSTEAKIVYDIGSAYDNYKLAIDNAADGMDRYNGRMDALRYVNDLQQFFK